MKKYIIELYEHYQGERVLVNVHHPRNFTLTNAEVDKKYFQKAYRYKPENVVIKEVTNKEIVKNY